MGRRTRWRAAAVMAMGLTVATACSQPPPDFYEPGSPAGAPGSVITSVASSFGGSADHKGWAVAITDYEKLGTPGDHTYVVAAAEAHAVLDIVRAASKLPGLGISASAPVGIMGYSQGGQAAAKAAELEGTYAPELDVRGVVAGGVPSDLGRLATSLNGSAFFTFLGYAAIGLDSAYPELDLEGYLNPTGAQLLETARGSCLVFDQGTSLRDAWCAEGTQVQWREYWLAEHAIGVVAGQADSIAFLNDRFSGAPFQPTCNA